MDKKEFYKKKFSRWDHPKLDEFDTIEEVYKRDLYDPVLFITGTKDGKFHKKAVYVRKRYFNVFPNKINY